jgi:hypothetical protein
MSASIYDVCHIKKADKFFDTPLERCGSYPLELTEIPNVLSRGQSWVEALRVRQGAEAVLGSDGVIHDIHTIDLRGASIWSQDGVENAESRRLAGTVGP